MITSYSEVVENGTVLAKSKKHKTLDRCDCLNTDKHNKYKEVTVEFDDKYYYFLHKTPVVVKLDKNTFRLDSGNWKTMSTKSRMNKIMPAGYKVRSVGGVWQVDRPHKKPLEFEDGMVFECGT